MKNETPSTVTELNESTLTKIRKNRKLQRGAICGVVAVAAYFAIRAGVIRSQDNESETTED